MLHASQSSWMVYCTNNQAWQLRKIIRLSPFSRLQKALSSSLWTDSFPRSKSGSLENIKMVTSLQRRSRSSSYLKRSKRWSIRSSHLKIAKKWVRAPSIQLWPQRTMKRSSSFAISICTSLNWWKRSATRLTKQTRPKRTRFLIISLANWSFMKIWTSKTCDFSDNVTYIACTTERIRSTRTLDSPIQCKWRDTRCWTLGMAWGTWTWRQFLKTLRKLHIRFRSPMLS